MSPVHPHFKIADLIAKQLREGLGADEAAMLNGWRHEHPDNQALYEWLTDPVNLQEALRHWPAEPDEAAWQSLMANLPVYDERNFFLRKVLPYAALLATCIIGAGLWWTHRAPASPAAITTAKQELTVMDIRPKGKVATLKLDNGLSMQLDSLHALAQAVASVPDNAVNIIETPRGGEYQLTLPDGSKVWLNNASSLRFPAHFQGGERQVHLSGEAYFEIAPDAKHPFIVSTQKASIRVLGTRFNVSAYKDDRYESTVVSSGLVQVMSHITTAAPVLLKPGFEVVIGEGKDSIQIDKADLEATLAWKDGLFIFDSAPLDEVLQRVARWYDVRVEYHLPAGQSLHFTGRIQKYENINALLHLLELTRRVRFEVKDRTVNVYPFSA